MLSGSARPCLIQLSTNYGPPEALRHFIRAHHPAGGEAGISRSPPSADWKIGPKKERRKRKTGAWARTLDEEAEALSPQRTLRDPSRWRGGGRTPSPDANPRARGIPPICRDPAKTSPAIRSEALESPAGITVRKRDDAPHPIAYHDAARVDDLEVQRPIVLRGAERLPELSLCNSWCDAAEVGALRRRSKILITSDAPECGGPLDPCETIPLHSYVILKVTLAFSQSRTRPRVGRLAATFERACPIYTIPVHDLNCRIASNPMRTFFKFGAGNDGASAMVSARRDSSAANLLVNRPLSSP